MDDEMKTERGRAFIRFKPSLANNEIRQAEETGHTVVSFDGQAVLDDAGERIRFLAVKFALANGETPTILLDPLATPALGTLLELPVKLNWSTASLKAGDTQH